MSDNQHIIYGDTDSVYLQLNDYADIHGLTLDTEMAVQIADRLQAKLQSDLAPIIGAKFATSAENIAILEPGREIVARKGLFKDKKKRYALHIVDDEGRAKDKMKIMGMETQRSDTPKFIQRFLLDCIEPVVMKDSGYDDIHELVAEFRAKFRAMDPWRRGSPGGVRNLGRATEEFEDYQAALARGTTGIKPPRMHVTVKAALNTNRLMELNNETRWAGLRDGDKVEVIYLKKGNDLGLDCVAIPTGETYVPDWFKELPFDTRRMEEKLIDRKLFNVLGDIMNWDFTPPKTSAAEVTKRMDDFYE